MESVLSVGSQEEWVALKSPRRGCFHSFFPYSFYADLQFLAELVDVCSGWSINAGYSNLAPS